MTITLYSSRRCALILKFACFAANFTCVTISHGITSANFTSRSIIFLHKRLSFVRIFAPPVHVNFNSFPLGRMHKSLQFFRSSSIFKSDTRCLLDPLSDIHGVSER
ncbi:unnamed protein product [Albugo candida]|uniref:Uncharacterized protein n=1 Tax=Albugo candida TaxID=65357 RepID=A0A024FX02_9STRA|nr:unnamed protein product [Albugo candida]|eukprot:CCI11713.1 unnamed protein product [Albugo candida]